MCLQGSLARPATEDARKRVAMAVDKDVENFIVIKVMSVSC